MDEKNLLIDTNVIMDYPDILNSDNKIFIISSSLKELDGLKKHLNKEVSEKARKAAVYISRNRKKIHFIDSDYLYPTTVDDQLIKIASQNPEYILVTNDIYLKIKAELKEVRVQGYTLKDDYCGVVYYNITLDEYKYNKVLEDAFNGIVPKDLTLTENQFLIFVEETTNEKYASFYYKDKTLKVVEDKAIKNKYIDYIKAKNTEQRCLINALFERDNTIIYAGGTYGSGKSFLLNNFALQELEKGKISKIVYIPNNAHTANTLEIGFLAGSFFEKILGQIGPLVDLVGVDRIQDMINKGELEIVPMTEVRGRSFNNSIIVVNEAQNLTVDHIKLLVARCGENSRIFFDGDKFQYDAQIFKDKSGLTALLQLHKSEIYSKIFATVKLQDIERSKTAQAAQYLDDISGNI